MPIEGLITIWGFAFVIAVSGFIVALIAGALGLEGWESETRNASTLASREKAKRWNNETKNAGNIRYEVYKTRQSILTETELKFYRLLRENVHPKIVILSKIALKDIFYIGASDEYQRHFNYISQKHIDFLLCHPNTLAPLFAIELDDSSHQQEKAVASDEFKNKLFAKAGLRLIRVPVRGMDRREWVTLIPEKYRRMG